MRKTGDVIKKHPARGGGAKKPRKAKKVGAPWNASNHRGAKKVTPEFYTTTRKAGENSVTSHNIRRPSQSEPIRQTPSHTRALPFISGPA